MIDFSTLALMWLFIIIALIVIEGLTVNLVTIWFALAAVPAFILSLLNVDIVFQLLAFGISAVALLIFTKPFVKKIQNGKTIKTNYESLIGEKAVALEKFGELTNGYVKVNGMDWLAHTEDTINKGDIVIIKSVSGAKVNVKKYEN